MSTLDILLSPSSGPLWAFAGVALTAIGSVLVNRRTSIATTSKDALDAVNVAHQQLVDGLFRQVETLTKQVETLRDHADDCERRHREAMVRIEKLEQVHPTS